MGMVFEESVSCVGHGYENDRICRQQIHITTVLAGRALRRSLLGHDMMAFD
jgi:hypothetical protein